MTTSDQEEPTTADEELSDGLEDLSDAELRKIATLLIQCLVEADRLELVNKWGKASLVEPLVQILEKEADLKDKVGQITEYLLDAPEVNELYATDEEIETIIEACRE